jgi:hypothetical protein
MTSVSIVVFIYNHYLKNKARFFMAKRKLDYQLLLRFAVGVIVIVVLLILVFSMFDILT